MEPGEQLFRHEAGRLVAVLTRIFGIHNLELAEDVVQDAFCRALEVWKIRGVPANPSAWLLTAAKNRALDVLRRERKAREFAPELTRLLESEWTLSATVSQAFAESTIKDDELRMMFSCCHPHITEQSQIALILNLVCGFGINEIASAFLSSRAATEKRLARAKRILAGSKGLFDLSDADFSERLSAVQRALYLLFSEGYHSQSAGALVRANLCREALRLAMLLCDNPLTATPASFALSALLHLGAARLAARVDESGNLIPLFEQDRSRWNRELIREGVGHLERSAGGSGISEYHIEAAIAAVHARAPSAAETDWHAIVALYDSLLELRPSPVVALNRAIAIGQLEGPERGLAELRAIADRERLAEYPFYSAALGEFELRRGSNPTALEHFQTALSLAHNPSEKRFLERRIAACREPS